MTATEKLYADHEGMIAGEVWRLHRRAGGDWAELKAEADWIFAHAAATFRPELGNRFSTWLVWQLRTRLLKTLQTRWATKHDRERPDFEALESRRGFDLDGWLGELSDDARFAARLALAAERHSTPAKRSAVVAFLADLGWCGARICESFREIREALQA